jgi:hypothetical protein
MGHGTWSAIPLRRFCPKSDPETEVTETRATNNLAGHSRPMSQAALPFFMGPKRSSHSSAKRDPATPKRPMPKSRHRKFCGATATELGARLDPQPPQRGSWAGGISTLRNESGRCFKVHEQWRRRLYARLRGLGKGNSPSLSVRSRHERMARRGQMSQKTHTATRSDPSLYGLQWMEAELPVEVKNRSRVDGSHAACTIRDGKT